MRFFKVQELVSESTYKARGERMDLGTMLTKGWL